ncbi:low molecular weight phosphatase family protein [Chloroflexales bacterium ZM16-3]|nr:low molecular weight phosphatase family protein [Chloroflexales bacterium ZM16-3]
MNTEPPQILIIGAADTGRAPMAAALLRRLLHQRGMEWPVTSAGVVGHDEEPPQTEARDAIAFLNLDISHHQARSLNDDLANVARVMLAIDSGVGLVLRARYPQAAIVSLGELAGRRRDIPDPFRMQVGAWVSYAREIEDLLSAGLNRLIAMVEGAPDPPPDEVPAAPAPVTRAAPPEAAPRHAAIERVLRLLDLLAEMPGVVDWAGARRQIDSDMSTLGAPLGPEDLSRPYVAITQAMLGLTPQPPTTGQAARLRTALVALRAPISAEDLAALSAGLANYPSL